MAKNKTTENENSITAYLSTIADEGKRKDTSALVSLIQNETGLKPKMWGTAIVGFGSYHYQYESGREGDAPLIGLSARVNAITLYLGAFEQRDEWLKQLGKHKEGKGCVYINKLSDISSEVLTKIIHLTIEHRRG